MDHNPYSPPEAVVIDAAVAPMPRPRSVNIALFLMVGMLAWYMWQAINEFPQINSARTFVGIVGWHGLKISAWMVLAVFIERGKSGARFGMLVFSLILAGLHLQFWNSFADARAEFHYQLDGKTAAVMLAPHGVRFLTVFLLLVPGRNWFRKHEGIQ